jgi:hypothetical protein
MHNNGGNSGYEIGPHHIAGSAPLPRYMPPDIERQLHQEHLDQLAPIFEAIRPYVPGHDDEQLFEFADEIATIETIEASRQGHHDWHGGFLLATDLDKDVDKLAAKNIGGSTPARRLSVFMNARLLRPNDKDFPKWVELRGKGPSIVLAHEDYEGNWNAERSVKKQIKALHHDPLILATHYFSNTYPTHADAITAYKIEEVPHIRGHRYSVIRDISYGDLVHKKTREKTEIHERLRFAVIPSLLSRENNELLANIAAAQKQDAENEQDTNKEFIRQKSRLFGQLVLEPALQAKKHGKLGETADVNVFPVGARYVALTREPHRKAPRHVVVQRLFDYCERLLHFDFDVATSRKR